MTEAKAGGRGRIARSLSLSRAQFAALDWMAASEGHRNRSEIAQRLIEHAMIERLGFDWRRKIAPDFVAEAERDEAAS